MLYNKKIQIKMYTNIKKFSESINNNNTYTMYTGISLKMWEIVWKNKNISDRVTNVTDDKSFANDYSYDFQTGKYDDVIVEISNIPLDAFVSYRVGNVDDDYDDEDEEETYADDDDFHSMNNISDNEKINIIDNYSLFLVSLYKYKEQITTTLIKM